jgi:sialic acid synthase
MASIGSYYDGVQVGRVAAVKFVKRDMRHELSREMYDMPYQSPHAYGPTYGLHREALELSYDQHADLARFAWGLGLDFIETACCPQAVEGIMRRFRPSRWKVASRDIDNEPLIDAMCATDIPIILSTGMTHDMRHIAMIADRIEREDTWILHCTSQYPTPFGALGLRDIPRLRVTHNMQMIGISDHSLGYLAPALAVAYGAQVVEKHITLDKGMQGTDHAGSLDIGGLQRMLRDIAHAEMAIGGERGIGDPGTQQKLRRQICSAREIRRGDTITDNMICLLSASRGIPWDQRSAILDHRARIDIPAQMPISLADVE